MESEVVARECTWTRLSEVQQLQRDPNRQAEAWALEEGIPWCRPGLPSKGGSRGPPFPFDTQLGVISSLRARSIATLANAGGSMTKAAREICRERGYNGGLTFQEAALQADHDGSLAEHSWINLVVAPLRDQDETAGVLPLSAVDSQSVPFDRSTKGTLLCNVRDEVLYYDEWA